MLGAQVHLLAVGAGLQIPEVNRVAVPVAEQQLRDDSVLDHGRRTPLAADQGVLRKVPPGGIREELRTAVPLPRTNHIEGAVVQKRDGARSVIAVALAKT